jgi:hypothetical protein
MLRTLAQYLPDDLLQGLIWVIEEVVIGRIIANVEQRGVLVADGRLRYDFNVVFLACVNSGVDPEQ